MDTYTSGKSTLQVNNTKLTKKNSTLHKKIVLKDAVALPPHSLLRILSHRIVPAATLNEFNINGLKGTSNRTLKIFLVILSIANNDSNAIAIIEAVNALMKLIHDIEGDAKKAKIS